MKGRLGCMTSGGLGVPCTRPCTTKLLCANALTWAVKFHHIRDPVHGFITIGEDGVLSDLIDTAEMQRLRYIRQLGVTYNIYPGAEHSRFFHSLGVAHLAGRMYDAVVPDVRSGDNDRERLQIAALLHDIGHAPFSHVLEEVLTPNVTHTEWSQRIIQSGETQIGEVIRKSTYTPQEIASLIGKDPSKPRYLHLIVSSQMDSDRFDYLLRDSYYTGTPCGNYDLERILRTILIGEDDVFRVKEKGKFSVEGYLISRYHMYNQVYLHKTTLCFEHLLRSILKKAIHLKAQDGVDLCLPKFDTLPIGSKGEVTPTGYISLTDNEIIASIRTWTNSSDPTLSDLCRRYMNRTPVFKPLKVPKLTSQSLYEKKEKMEKVLLSRNMDPTYYLHTSLGEAKDAYRPYSPQREDQENAILLESGMEISTELQSLRALSIGPLTLVCVPEELRGEIEEVLR